MQLRSELLLNPQGRIYHLNLKPDELASTIITVGDPDRVQEVSKYFDKMEHKTKHREFVTHTGYLGNGRITVLSTGIGTGSIDIVMNELDALVNVDFATGAVKEQKTRLQIVRLGTSGSLQGDIQVGSLVVSDLAIGFDNLMHFYEYDKSEEELWIEQNLMSHFENKLSPVVPYAVMGAQNLSSLFLEKYHHGITVTCPGFYAPQGRVLRAGLKYPKLIENLSSFYNHNKRITNFEMETAALYGMGRVLQHDCISINAIVANRISNTFTSSPEECIENMIRKTLPFLEKL